MFRKLGIRACGLLVATVVALAVSFASSGGTALAQACDPSGSTNGSAVPSTVLPGQMVAFTATSFTAGENVSFWFTLPDGNVFGTANPLCCAARDGSVRFPPIALPSDFYQFPGRWAMTVQGASSQRQAIIYFCVLTSAPAATNTPAPPPATNTPVPAPATATSAPAATNTPAAAATSTVAVGEASPTAGVAPPTTAPVDTPAPLPTTAVTEPEPTAVVVGMPTTGQADASWLLISLIALAGLSTLTLGLAVRRTLGGNQ